MKEISKDIVLAAVVRSFFKYFVTGILEEQTGTDIQNRFEPINIKKTMLNHYEHISRYFNREAFFALMRLNFTTEEMEQQLREFMKPGTSDMELVRFACRTDNFYQAMVSEYKRNFELLLCGRLEQEDEHDANYTRLPEGGTIDAEMAEKIIGEIAAHAYSHGKNIGKTH